jgi:hypothetical protein
LLIGTFGVGIAWLDSFLEASKAMPGCESHPEPRRLPAITMESCPPSRGTLPAISWNAARDRLERRPPSAWNRARHRAEYAVRLALESQREEQGRPPPVALRLSEEVARRDRPVHSRALASYDRIVQAAIDQAGEPRED